MDACAKARFVAESLAPGACISEIARQNGSVPSLLLTLRRRARVRVSKAEPVFLPLQVTEMSASLKVGADVDAAALARVLDVLERR